MMQKQGDVVDLAMHRSETNEQLLERLFREHGAALRGFLWTLLGPDEDMDDIVQELFARLAKLDDLKAKLPTDKSRWRSYLISAANNLAVDIQRHKQVRRNYQDTLKAYEHDARVEDTPESIALSREELAAAQRAIMGLRPRWRRAFILNRFHYKSYRQIAVEMGVSVKQVEKYMKQALIRVRDAALNNSEEVPR